MVIASILHFVVKISVKARRVLKPKPYFEKALISTQDASASTRSKGVQSLLHIHEGERSDFFHRGGVVLHKLSKQLLETFLLDVAPKRLAGARRGDLPSSARGVAAPTRKQARSHPKHPPGVPGKKWSPRAIKVRI